MELGVHAGLLPGDGDGDCVRGRGGEMRVRLFVGSGNELGEVGIGCVGMRDLVLMLKSLAVIYSPLR